MQKKCDLIIKILKYIYIKPYLATKKSDLDNKIQIMWLKDKKKMCLKY